MNFEDTGRSELNARGVLLLAIPLLLCGAVFFVHDYDLHGLVIDPLYPLVLGAGFYLVYAGGAARLAGLAGLLLLAIIFGLPGVIFPALIANDWGQMNWGAFFPSFIWTLIAPAAVAALALVAASKKDAGRPFNAYSLWAGLAILFIMIFVYGPGTALFHDFDAFKARRLIKYILTALALPIYARLAKDFCRTGGDLFTPSVWGRLWCGFVFVMTMSMLVYYAFEQGRAALLTIMSLPAAVGMFLLVFGLRGGFHLVILGLSFTVTTRLIAIPEAGGQWPAAIGAVIGALLNFLITWALLRAALAQSWSRAERPQEPMPLIVPILEILTAGLGLLLIVVAWIDLMKGLDKTHLLIALAAGAIILLMNAFAAAQGFRRKDYYVLHVVCLMVMTAITIFVTLGLAINA